MDERQFPGEDSFRDYTSEPEDEAIPLTFSHSAPDDADEKIAPEMTEAAENLSPESEEITDEDPVPQTPPQWEAPAAEEEGEDDPAWQAFPSQEQEQTAPEAAQEIPETPLAENAQIPSPEPTLSDWVPDVPEDIPSAEPSSDEEEITDLVILDGGEETLELTAPEQDAAQESLEEQPDDEADQEYRDNGMDVSSQQEKPIHVRPVKKGRPKRKSKEWLFGIPSMVSAVVWLCLIVAIGVTIGRMLWVCAADMLAFGRPDRTVTLTVYESDTMDDIVNKLHESGLIRYKGLFNLYADISHAEEKIKPGIYDLNTQYDYHALVNLMSPRSSRQVVDVTIPEGYSCRQIFALLEENRICTAQDISAYAANGELNDFWFLENVERGDKYCLEGFLFPDTYQFYKNSTPREALEKMLTNFDVRFSDEMKMQLEELNTGLTGDYTVREITIVASLIEKESAAPAESPKIAGVIYNRLFNWDSPAYLNIDASVIYALDGKTDLTREDLNVDSPYNTYTHIGLTPTPISNPGLSSLQAALQPESHEYYYYVLNPATGMHQFSKTYEEHNEYVNAFNQGEQ